MKKILVFSTAYFPHVGGAEVAIKEIVDRAPEYDFDLICARLDAKIPKTEKIGRVMIYRIGWGMPSVDKLALPFLGASKALSLSRTNRYVLYWCMMATFGSGAAYIANIIRFWRPTPIVLTLQEGDSPEYIRSHRFGLLNLSWTLALRYASAVTVISTYLAGMARDYGYRGSIEIIPNAVDAKRFSQHFDEGQKKKIRDELSRQTGEVLVVTTSRLVVKNAVDDVIRAMMSVPKSVRFVVFGVGADLAQLKELAISSGVQDRVDFRGQMSQEDLPLYLQSCDIFIRPSRSEGFGISFVEAFAAGIPVIATQEGGIADFLFDEKRNHDKPTTGWAVDKDSPEQIAAAVKDIMARPAKVAEVVANAKKLAFEKYDWDMIARDMREKVFARLGV